MELKVWVDGIQKVVCGTNYYTTCQDVVLALASALGQTGRFTLVEKWRDSERPLIPSECPLQSLNRWGEYAREVQFYLVQAKQSKSDQQKESSHRASTSEGHKPKFVHNFTSPQPSQNFKHPVESKLVKRSSTFSGAQSSLLCSLSHRNLNAHEVTPSTLSLTSEHQHKLAPSGKLSSSSPGSFNSVSIPSSSTSVKNITESVRSRISSEPSQKIAVTYKEDTRELHPANMPGVYSSHVNHAGIYSSLPSHSQNPFKCIPSPKPVSSNQIQHSDPGNFHQQLSKSVKNSNPSPSSYSHPALKMTSHHANISHQQAPSSQSVSHQNSQLHQQPLKVPPRRHQPGVGSPTFDREKATDHMKGNQKSSEQMEILNVSNYESKPITAATNNGILVSKTFMKDDTERNSMKFSSKSVNNFCNGQEHILSSSNLNCKSDNTGENLSKRMIPQTSNKLESIAHERITSENTFRSSVNSNTDTVKFATVDRPVKRSKPRPSPPTRSLSTGAGDAAEKKQVQLTSYQLNSNTNEKDSVILGVQRSSTDKNNNRKMSSFASAVAHIRQLSGDIDNIHKNNVGITHTCQHYEDDLINHYVNDSLKEQSNARQHNSDNIKTNHSFNGKFAQSIGISSVKDECSLGMMRAHDSVPVNNQQNKNNSFQPSEDKPLTSSGSYSDLVEVSLRSRHREMKLLPSLTTFTSNVKKDNASSINCIKNTSSEKEHIHIPDVSYENLSSSRKGKEDEQTVLPADYRLADDTSSSQIQKQYSQLLKTVKLQQEQIETKEAEINRNNLEICNLEKEALSNKAKLEAFVEEIAKFEKQEADLQDELQLLETEDWPGILDKEQKLEMEMKLQLTVLKEKLDQMEAKIRQLKDDEDQKCQELTAEKGKADLEKANNEEIERQVNLEKKHIEYQLANLDKVIDESKQKLKDMETELLKADKEFSQKEEEVKMMEEKEICAANDNFHTSVNAAFPVKSTDTDFPILENGEAILKILESQMSVCTPASPTRGELDSKDGITSAQHLYNSVSVKSPNGIWV